MKSSATRRKGASKPALQPEFQSDCPGDVDRLERISVAAYYRAESRGFEPGGAMDDWLRAEAEVDRPAVG